MHQQPRGGRLAAAGFADDPDCFAFPDRKRNVIDRPHRLARAEEIAAHRKMLGETLDLEQRLRSAAAIFDRLKRFDGWGDLTHWFFLVPSEVRHTDPHPF